MKWEPAFTTYYLYLSTLKVFVQTGSSSDKYKALVADEEEARDNISQMFSIDFPPIPSFNDNLQTWRAFLDRILAIFDSLPHISGNYKESYENFKKALLNRTF